ncbi:hypothetical protein H101_07868 [Trichophyton interdigitale H6]|nr:hypothetical protein H101_07868 [Trichophyton interdigitale H6]
MMDSDERDVRVRYGTTLMSPSKRTALVVPEISSLMYLSISLKGIRWWEDDSGSYYCYPCNRNGCNPCLNHKEGKHRRNLYEKSRRPSSRAAISILNNDQFA